MKLSIVLSLCSLLTTVNSYSQEYKETLYKGWAQSFSIDEVLYEEKTELQEMILFKNKLFGTVLALDGCIQLCEKDEFIYHEALVHLPMFSHDHPEHVLVIGGGDGGIIREVLKHKEVKSVTLVEIDGSVVEFSKKHLPFVSNGAFDDARVEVVIGDGSKYVKETNKLFDVIICDSTDPFGPAECLFTKEFYTDCKNILTEKGIFVNQSGVPFMQADELKFIHTHLSMVFNSVDFYLAAVPTYVGGQMALGFSSNYKYSPNAAALKEKINASGISLRFYNDEYHLGAFNKPKFIQEVLE